MMIRLTFLKNMTYFKKKIFYFHHKTNLNHLSLWFPASFKTVVAETQTQELVFIVWFTGCYLAPPCGHCMSPQCVSVQSVCFIFRGWRFPWSLCCSGQLPRCHSPTVSTHTTGEDKAPQDIWETISSVSGRHCSIYKYSSNVQFEYVDSDGQTWSSVEPEVLEIWV